ncbi:MAG TPA: competence/damage-inducible protein A [Phycisphaerae bacterium]|nr:competence/damage-inducible protein A [Phycisphaerae bacterium]
MRAVILSIGDELVSGLTINTNAAWLSEQLMARGIAITAHLTVGDSLLHIVEAIRAVIGEDAAAKADMLLISGGLGPTEDDLTRQALADALNEPLVEDPDAVLFLDRWFAQRRRSMSPSNRLQALRPVSAVCIENTKGTAPGLRIEKEGSPGIFVMPGVPGEMREMFTESILPRIEKRRAAAGGAGGGEAGEVTLVTKINTFGMGESVLGERIKELMVRGGNPGVGTTVHEGIVSVRIYATGTPEEAAAMTERVRREVGERLGPVVFGENEETLESTLAALLNAGRRTLATAESCTGGLLAKLLTDTAGASGYFARGWVTYANDAKHDELGIPTELLDTHGAVSEAVAVAMAENARKFARTDFALATTGIAGPTGGTETKPVGLVWIALASAEGTAARSFVFPGDRGAVRLRAAQMAMALLRWRLLGHDPA